MTDFRHQAEEAVRRAYDQYYARVLDDGFRRKPFYVLSKADSDWKLMKDLDLAGKRVLNIGCSEPIDELFWAAYPFRDWIAIDNNERGIAAAVQILANEMAAAYHHKFRFVVADARTLPFPDASFDLVLSFHMIDHIVTHEDRQSCFGEIARVMKPDGHAAITTTNRRGHVRCEHEEILARGDRPCYGYAYFFSRRELRRMLVAAGLAPLQFTSETTIPYVYEKWFYRLINALAGRYGDRIGYLCRKA